MRKLVIIVSFGTLGLTNYCFSASFFSRMCGWLSPATHRLYPTEALSLERVPGIPLHNPKLSLARHRSEISRLQWKTFGYTAALSALGLFCIYQNCRQPVPYYEQGTSTSTHQSPTIVCVYGRSTWRDLFDTAVGSSCLFYSLKKFFPGQLSFHRFMALFGCGPESAAGEASKKLLAAAEEEVAYQERAFTTRMKAFREITQQQGSLDELTAQAHADVKAAAKSSQENLAALQNTVTMAEGLQSQSEQIAQAFDDFEQARPALVAEAVQILREEAQRISSQGRKS